MGDLPGNYFEEPLVGSTGIRNDGVDPTEILNYLFKKSFGIPNAQVYKDYANDFSGSYNSTQSIKNNYIFSQQIPNTKDLSDLILINNWLNLGHQTSGEVPNNTYGYKYISSNYPYLAYYSNVLMKTTNAPSPSLSFIVGDPPNNVTSKNMIPYFYGDGISYNIQLYNYSGTNTIIFGDQPSGSWIMDTDSGILTFYDDVQSSTGFIVNADNPPRITFWRYEGLTGNSGIVNVGSY
jgi:hypothetical protein